MSKPPERKPRDEYIYARVAADEGGRLSITFNSETGGFTFGGVAGEVYSQRTYDRPKGPKVISQISQPNADAVFSVDGALMAHYDRIFAVDTNTMTKDGVRISVTSVIELEAVWAQTAAGLAKFWRPDPLFGVQCIGAEPNPENVGWYYAIVFLQPQIDFRREKICFIVDSDLGSLNDYNTLRKPFCGDYRLPPRTQLIYASADVGQDISANQALRFADRIAKALLMAVQSETVPPIAPSDSPQFCASFRLLTLNKHQGTGFSATYAGVTS